MKPFSLFIFLGIVGLVLGGLLTTYTECRESEVVVVDGMVLNKATAVIEEEVSVLKPGCATCPGSSYVVEVQSVPTTHYYLVVGAMLDGKPVQWEIEVSATVYAAADLGGAVQVRLTRGKRWGRECQSPEVLLEPAM
ncbi:MAG TPA: hypothetical protein PKG50_04465 [Candidatus Bipolaricaulis anaerobius]|nr:hypothetical protein [Candidatus Bipolaricaulis anaerobius]HNS23254.1 hypothetical protein [Candidatus Bipolaricaulis anaerobius]